MCFVWPSSLAEWSYIFGTFAFGCLCQSSHSLHYSKPFWSVRNHRSIRPHQSRDLPFRMIKTQNQPQYVLKRMTPYIHMSLSKRSSLLVFGIWITLNQRLVKFLFGHQLSKGLVGDWWVSRWIDVSRSGGRFGDVVGGQLFEILCVFLFFF